MAERLEVPARGPVAPGADGSDVVDKLGECGPADAPTLPAPRLAPEHLGPDPLPKRRVIELFVLPELRAFHPLGGEPLPLLSLV
jgi:hypothetical protein